MKLATIVMTGLLLFASAGVALAHGEADNADQESSTYGPVQSATLAVVDMKVPNYETARQDVSAAALAQGGKLVDLHTWVDPKGKKHGWIRFTMSSDHLAMVLPPVYAVGKLYSEKMTTEDYKSDSDQLERRIASLTRHEGRLDSLLNSNRRMRGSDLLYIQERLFRADVDAGMLDQQRIDMAGAQNQASLQVELFEPGTLPVTPNRRINVKERFAASLNRAHDEANQQLARASTAGAYLLVFAPVWAPALLIALVALWLIWRMRQRIFAWVLRTIALLITLLHRPIGGNGSRIAPTDV
jgi:hypothetical protein